LRTHRTKQFESAEPMGIVISDGGNGNVTSRLAAFVWGPVPEDVLADLESDDMSDELLLAAVA
jgi:hypothetical protein